MGAILNFLLQLGFREVGSAFRVDSLSTVERTIAADVAQLGLLMPFMYTPLHPAHSVGPERPVPMHCYILLRILAASVHASLRRLPSLWEGMYVR